MTRDLAKSGEVRVRAEIAREYRPCALCGEFVLHGVVEPAAKAALIFRASVDLYGKVWVPVPHLDCPDPPEDTASFWSDEVKREAFKSRSRSAARAARAAR